MFRSAVRIRLFPHLGFNVMSKNTEQRIADAILQRPIGSLEIDGITFEIGPPALATLILVSEIASQAPAVDKSVSRDDCVMEVLRIAKDCKMLGEMAAVLILGANGLKGKMPRKWLGPLKRFMPRKTVDLKELLAEKISLYCSPKAIASIIAKKLIDMEVEYFFDITISLSEINLLRPTKDGEVVTTAFGPSYSEPQRTSE